jgi:hypothetical protein
VDKETIPAKAKIETIRSTIVSQELDQLCLAICLNVLS